MVGWLVVWLVEILHGAHVVGLFEVDMGTCLRKKVSFRMTKEQVIERPKTNGNGGAWCLVSRAGK